MILVTAQFVSGHKLEVAGRMKSDDVDVGDWFLQGILPEPSRDLHDTQACASMIDRPLMPDAIYKHQQWHG